MLSCSNLSVPCTGEYNNDRLALLGDSVLDLVVLQQGMRHKPDASNLGECWYKPTDG